MATMHARHTTSAGLVAALAMLAGVLAGCSDATNTDEASTRSSSDPTSASATTSTGEPTPPTGVLRIGEIDEGGLKPGRYAIPPVGPHNEPHAVVDIPAGYGTFGPFIYAEKPAESGDPLAIGLWFITGVYLNPCAETKEVSPTSVLAIADAFLRQRLTSATKPQEVSLDGGYHALYMEVTTPTGFDLSTCDDAELNLWEGRPDGNYWTRTPGMVEKLWIVDVDAHPMVIHMAVPPSATGPQIQAMTKIVESATFKTPDA